MKITRLNPPKPNPPNPPKPNPPKPRLLRPYTLCSKLSFDEEITIAFTNRPHYSNNNRVKLPVKPQLKPLESISDLMLFAIR